MIHFILPSEKERNFWKDSANYPKAAHAKNKEKQTPLQRYELSHNAGKHIG